MRGTTEITMQRNPIVDWLNQLRKSLRTRRGSDEI